MRVDRSYNIDGAKCLDVRLFKLCELLVFVQKQVEYPSRCLVNKGMVAAICSN